MAEPKTFVLKRSGTPRWDCGPGFFNVESGGIMIFIQEVTTDANEIEVVVTPRKSVRERKTAILHRLMADGNEPGSIAWAIDALEAIDRGEP